MPSPWWTRGAWASVVLGGIGMVSVAVNSGMLDRVPLLDVTVGATVESIAACALLVSWACAGRRSWQRTVPAVVGGSAALTATIAALLWATDTVTDAYPPTFGVWVGLGFAAVAWLPFALFARRSGGPAVAAPIRRATAALAVPLTLVGAVMLIDNEYGIWPQVGDLLGHAKVLTNVAGGDRLPSGDSSAPPDSSPPPVPPDGVLTPLDPPSTVSHLKHRPGLLYLPPAYFRRPAPVLPVLIMLGGTPGTPINWVRAGKAELADQAYAAAHDGVAPILAVVDQNGTITGDTECVDGPQGNAETYLTVDVPRYLTSTLHVTRDPRLWGIVGFSEGGTCALDLTLMHLDLYRTFVDLSGETEPSLNTPKQTLDSLFGGSRAALQAHDPLRLLATYRYPQVNGWFAAGQQDHDAITTTHRMAAAAQRSGMRMRELTVPWAHDWRFAGAAFAEILPQLCTEMLSAPVLPDPSAGAGHPSGRVSSSPSRPARPDARLRASGTRAMRPPWLFAGGARWQA